MSEDMTTLIPEGHAERLNWFRQLAHVVHLGRCTRFPFGGCRRHEEAEYFTPKDNDIASVVIKWLEFDASVRAEVLARKQEKQRASDASNASVGGSDTTDSIFGALGASGTAEEEQ